MISELLWTFIAPTSGVFGSILRILQDNGTIYEPQIALFGCPFGLPLACCPCSFFLGTVVSSFIALEILSKTIGRNDISIEMIIEDK